MNRMMSIALARPILCPAIYNDVNTLFRASVMNVVSKKMRKILSKKFNVEREQLNIENSTMKPDWVIPFVIDNLYPLTTGCSLLTTYYSLRSQTDCRFRQCCLNGMRNHRQ